MVPSGPLAEVLHSFVDDWKRTRPVTSGQFAPGNQRTVERDTLSAIEYLSLETERQARRASPRARGVPSGTIEGLLAKGPDGTPRPRSRVTELRVADSLLAAAGRTDVFYEPGRLPVLPNPNASRAARQACCSGSLTG